MPIGCGEILAGFKKQLLITVMDAKEGLATNRISGAANRLQNKGMPDGDNA